MPFYVAPEQQMKDRADFARKGIARGRSVIVLRYADGILFVAENRSQALHKVSEIYDRLGLRRGRSLQRVREPADRRHPVRGPARLQLRPHRRHRPRTGQRVRAAARHHLLLRRREAVRGGDRRRRAGSDRRDRPDLPAHLRRLGRRRERVRGDGRLGRGDHRDGAQRATSRAWTSPRRSGSRCASLSTDGGPNATPRELGASALEVAILDRSRALPRKFRRIQGQLADRAADRRPGPSEPAPPGSRAGGATGRRRRRRSARPSSGTRTE